MKALLIRWCMICLAGILLFSHSLVTSGQDWSFLLPVAGADDDFIGDICSDQDNNIIAGGTFRSAGLTFDPVIVSSPNNISSPFYLTDIFIVKYSSGGIVSWAKSGGGNYGDRLTAIATDGNGNICFTGYFSCDTFRMDTVIRKRKSLLGVDMFAGKLDPQGNLLWFRNFGDKYDVWARDICTDAAGNLYIVGDFTCDSIDFDSVRIYEADSWGDIFVLKLDAGGNVLRAAAFGGNSEELAVSVECRNNSVAIAGTYHSSDLQVGNTLLTNRGEWESFIAVLNTDLQPLAAKAIGGEAQDMITCMDMNETGEIAVAGIYRSDTLYIDNRRLVNYSAEDDLPQNDIFLARYDAQFNLISAYTYGSLPNDNANSVCFAPGGNIWLGGHTVSPVLDIGNHPVTHSQPGSGYSDGFIVCIDNQGNGVWSDILYSDLDDENLLVALDNDRRVLVSGNYRGSTLHAGSFTIDNSATGGLYEPFIAVHSTLTLVGEAKANAPLIYPNPVSGTLLIKNMAPGNNRFEIWDACGRRIKVGFLSGNHALDAGFLEAGWYFLKIVGSDGIYTAPFLKVP